jgi:hypothetical protein
VRTALAALWLLGLGGCYAQRYEYHPEAKVYQFRLHDLWVEEAFPEPGRPGRGRLPEGAYEGLFDEDRLRDECPLDEPLGRP